MKKLLTILLIIITTSAKAQCDTASIMIRCVFDMKINTPYFDYYNPDGTLLWKRVKYDSTLIPTGGYAIRVTTNKTVEGYAVLKVIDPVYCTVGLIRWMDLNMKDIDGTVKYYEPKR